MKKYTLFFVCCLAPLFAAATVSAQGFIGPGANPPPPPGGTPVWYGFTGPTRTVTVEQAKTFAHKAPVVVTGAIVQAIGGDLYVFRDSSGEIIIRIGPREWYNLGSIISPTENIEISGELHRDKKYWQRAPEIHARYIRKI
ncbi:MAG: NirD/YgiW/YdeI family stress tolerance protein [Treponema sp.]|nr:NirD/YgiW/YdeI family stress tolerance protein [Treponema sp.]